MPVQTWDWHDIRGELLAAARRGAELAMVGHITQDELAGALMLVGYLADRFHIDWSEIRAELEASGHLEGEDAASA